MLVQLIGMIHENEMKMLDTKVNEMNGWIGSTVIYIRHVTASGTFEIGITARQSLMILQQYLST